MNTEFTDHPNPLFDRRSGNWIVYLALLSWIALMAAAAWAWVAASAPRGLTSAIILATFVVATAGCIAQAVGTGSQRDGRPAYYILRPDNTWAPYVSLVTPRATALAPVVGTPVVAVLVAGVIVRQGAPTVVEVVAFVAYALLANGALLVSHRHAAAYRADPSA
ncbi:hypothetical protein [Tsukamurella paurometabola]|uniref:Integral membrane protein n=1 Tax=Tsukamurella paurometabola TaxID=2061 RepID=A0ABS5NKM1_TSUPA|nr:hypothetical protein [Tsukamurella paurometabola]MBS4104478.1 hypothetical protein [Tsukamurella paurometabola]